MSIPMNVHFGGIQFKGINIFQVREREIIIYHFIIVIVLVAIVIIIIRCLALKILSLNKIKNKIISPENFHEP